MRTLKFQGFQYTLHLEIEVIALQKIQFRWVPDSNNEKTDFRIDYIIPNQAHHIVESHGGDGIGREILRKADIDINSAANGVLLPMADGDGTGNATVHNGSHNNEYSHCVNRALQKAVADKEQGRLKYTKAVIETLSKIRVLLLTQNLALNARGDADYDVVTQNGMSITEIFRGKGLI